MTGDQIISEGNNAFGYYDLLKSGGYAPKSGLFLIVYTVLIILFVSKQYKSEKTLFM